MNIVGTSFVCEFFLQNTCFTIHLQTSHQIYIIWIRKAQATNETLVICGLNLGKCTYRHTHQIPIKYLIIQSAEGFSITNAAHTNTHTHMFTSTFN